MTVPIIQIDQLGKRYRIGRQQAAGRSSRQAFKDALISPFRNLKRLRSLTRFNDDEADDIIWALKDISFEVHPGEVVGIIGKNGAGKSTLLKILSRIVDPSTGQALLRGRVGSLLEVGTGFHPEMTGRENIYLNGTILGMRKREIDRHFDEIVEFSEIGKFIDTPVKHYSSGMYVRLAFAVAAHLDSEILLVDEVLAVGDAAFQRKCLERMSGVSKEGRTVLFVSHNMMAIQTLCERAVLLDQGRLADQGATDDIVKQYLDIGVENGLEWTRREPPNESASIDRVYLADDNLKPIKTVQMSDSIRMVVDFTIRQPIPELKMSLDVMDAYGTHIFVSTPADSDLPMPEAIGSHRYIIEFPKGIWLTRRYVLRVNMNSSKTHFHDHSGNIEFTTEEGHTFVQKDGPATKRCGQIALLCRWSRRD